MNKIIAVDFDGTLTIGDHWPEIGEPNWPVINYILQEQRHGAKLILWTCRSDKPLEYAVEWCQDHGIIFDAVNENLPETLKRLNTQYKEGRKIVADEYIDDKALNPDSSNLLYADNIPILYKNRNYRQEFKTHICHILRRYYPSDWYELQHIAEDMLRELWKIEDC